MTGRDVLKLATAVVVSELAGVVGAVFTAPAIVGWYAELAKPALNPPAWVFGPVWTALYALMGIALFFVWRVAPSPARRSAMLLFAAQLVLNALWSVLFFGLESPLAALADILALFAAIVATMAAFSRVSRAAAYFLVPYLLWVAFATYLNASIVVLNY